MVRTSALTWVNVPSQHDALSIAGFSTVIGGNGKEEQGPGKDAAGRMGACLGQTFEGNT